MNALHGLLVLSVSILLVHHARYHLLCQLPSQQLTSLSNFVDDASKVDSPEPPLQCLYEHSSSAICLSIDAPRASGYYQFIEQCIWKPAGARVDLFWVLDNDMKYRDRTNFARVDTTAFKSQVCESKGEQEWQAFRIGPFSTQGGYSWSGLGAILNSSFIPTYQRAGLHAFDVVALGNIDQSNRLIWYPPLHQHHFHVFHGGFYDANDINIHGDTQCHGSHSGTRCLVHETPPGSAYIVNARVGLYSIFNDIRVSNSPVIRTWPFFAFRVAKKQSKIRQVKKTMIGVFWFGKQGLGGTLAAPSDVNTVVWNAGTVDKGVSKQSYVEAYFHSHSKALRDLWVFRGRPNAVFANVTQARNAYLNLEVGHTRLMENIHARMLLPTPAPLSCSYMAGSKIEWLQVGGVWTQFYRKSRCSWDADEKDWVFVAFFRRKPMGLSHTEPYFMHAGLRIYYQTEPDQLEMIYDRGRSTNMIAAALQSGENYSVVPPESFTD